MRSVSIGRLADLVGFHLRRASGAFLSDYNEAMAATGLRQTLIAILSVIEANPKIRQGAVGSALGIKRANMVSLVNELLEGGLIERQPDDRDRRAMSLTLTSKGESTLRDGFAIITEHEARMLAPLTPAERMMLGELLRKVSSGSK